MTNQRNGGNQVQRAFHIEDPHEQSATSHLLRHQWNRRQREQGRKQVAERCRIGELRRDAGIRGSGREEHQSE
jgi:hypothetical protein